MIFLVYVDSLFYSKFPVICSETNKQQKSYILDLGFPYFPQTLLHLCFPRCQPYLPLDSTTLAIFNTPYVRCASPLLP